MPWHDLARRQACAWLFTAATLLGVVPGSDAAHAIAGAEAASTDVPPGPVAVNDNRTPAGAPAGAELTLRLVAGEGDWRPDGEQGVPLRARAFGVEGRSLQVPAPLIRVTEGTEVQVVVTNRLAVPIAVHGLYTRPARGAEATTPLAVDAGSTREVRFVAGVPGTYYYWGASDATKTLATRDAADSQLSGAFVVDARDGPRVDDRVLVITAWSRGGQAGQPGAVFRYAINGRSWPHTERLTYPVGEQVRMRLANVGSGVHPMHLHGFYFDVRTRGDERGEVALPPGASPRLVVTERLPVGATFALVWTPTRPGNWLFHCHDTVHIVHGGALDGTPSRPAGRHPHIENHALEMMAGPVMGITVTGASVEAPEPGGPRRLLRLTARALPGGTDAEPAFGYVLEDPRAPGTASPSSPGAPVIVLQRGEPVSITVVNGLDEPTSVHWHGIELESYFDGVPGYAGLGTRIAPAIAPGASFEARFTPPRAGTFMYHSHVDEVRQQQGGLTGALLVLDDPARYDPQHDLVLLVSVPRRAADQNVVLLNGSSAPSPLEMRVGERYRLRFINLHTFRPAMRMKLYDGPGLATWRAVAKDGMDLPAERRVEGPAEIQMGNGEAYDFEFVPARAGALRVDVTSGVGQLLVTMPVQAR